MNGKPKGPETFLRRMTWYRCLTTRQAVTAGLGSEQMIRRYVRELGKAGILQSTSWQLGQNTGRPENLFLPTIKGLKIASNTGQRPLEPRCFAHQYYLNWCRIWLLGLRGIDLGLEPSFLADRLAPQTEASSIIPDGVFLLRSRPLKKTLLFFLEIDMGTEPLASPRKRAGDLREKIVGYRELFVSGHYLNYAPADCALQGFRVLFVFSDGVRLAQFGRLCQQLVPCDFVWSTTFESLDTRGIGAIVWQKGGDTRHRYSILGSLANDYERFQQRS